jgi:tetratricopeptide (TPR) repeat protein
MNKDSEFRYTVPPRPEGEALTFEEVEQRFLRQLDAKEGNCAQALENLARLCAQMGRHEEAIRYLEQLIALSNDPEEHAAYHLALGANMERVGDFPGAVKFYRHALGMEPCGRETWYFIHNNLGYSLNQLGRHDEAIPYLRHAIKIDPDYSNAHKNLGLAMEAKGQFAEAASFYVSATQANAADPRSLAHLENLMHSRPEVTLELPDLMDRLEACREAVKLALSHQPDFEALWKQDRLNQKRE